MNVQGLNDLENQQTSWSIQNGFSNIPQLTKTLATISFVFLSLGVLFPSSIYLFAMIPRNIYTVFFVWTFGTAGFYETSILSGLANIFFLVLLGKMIEPNWGSKEFLKFTLLTIILSNICSFFLLIFLSTFSSSSDTKERLLYRVAIYGSSALIAGFSVVIKQLMPEKEITIFLKLKLRAKHIPGTLILLSGFFFLLFGFGGQKAEDDQEAFEFGPPPTFILNVFGILISWTYLRFFQPHPSLGSDLVGDLNQNFAFYTFFPEVVQSSVSSFGSIIFKIFKLLGFCKNIYENAENNFQIDLLSSNNTVNQSNNSYQIQQKLGGDDQQTITPDAERRRALALQALQNRLENNGAPQANLADDE